MNKKFLIVVFLVFVLSITGCAKEDASKQDSVPKETVETPPKKKQRLRKQQKLKN